MIVKELDIFLIEIFGDLLAKLLQFIKLVINHYYPIKQNSHFYNILIYLFIKIKIVYYHFNFIKLFSH